VYYVYVLISVPKGTRHILCYELFMVDSPRLNHLPASAFAIMDVLQLVHILDLLQTLLCYFNATVKFAKEVPVRTVLQRIERRIIMANKDFHQGVY